MKEKPILFSAPMVRAILAGRKTQTRRVVKVCPKKDGVFVSGRSIIPETYVDREGVVGYCPRPDGASKGRASFVVYLLDGMGLAWRPYGGSPDVPWPRERIGEVSPYGGPGSRLWVRETWRVRDRMDPAFAYRADANTATDGHRWRPSIFMPRWASRITLEVTNARVQRLWAVSREDCIAEGCPPDDWYRVEGGPEKWYRTLWDAINGARAPWSSNPWVFAISFRRVDAARQGEAGEVGA